MSTLGVEWVIGRNWRENESPSTTACTVDFCCRSSSAGLGIVAARATEARAASRGRGAATWQPGTRLCAGDDESNDAQRELVEIPSTDRADGRRLGDHPRATRPRMLSAAPVGVGLGWGAHLVRLIWTAISFLFLHDHDGLDAEAERNAAPVRMPRSPTRMAGPDAISQ